MCCMDYFKKAPILKGNKVTLRMINPDIDNQSFFDMFLEPDLHLWTGNTVPINENETYELLCKYRDLNGLISWAIINNETQEFIGTYWIALEDENPKLISSEAQRIGKKYWRQGYTKEARILIYDFVFFQLFAEEIHAVAWKDNINSCKSMEYIGFSLIHTEKSLFSKRNQVLEKNHYILKKEIWIKRRQEILL